MNDIQVGDLVYAENSNDAYIVISIEKNIAIVERLVAVWKAKERTILPLRRIIKRGKEYASYNY
jgi:hypothetical protein